MHMRSWHAHTSGVLRCLPERHEWLRREAFRARMLSHRRECFERGIVGLVEGNSPAAMPRSDTELSRTALCFAWGGGSGHAWRAHTTVVGLALWLLEYDAVRAVGDLAGDGRWRTAVRVREEIVGEDGHNFTRRWTDRRSPSICAREWLQEMAGRPRRVDELLSLPQRPVNERAVG